MKYNLETLSNEKFLINFLFDILLGIKISLKKYWYLFIIINVLTLYAANYHFGLQLKAYNLSSTIRLGSMLTPNFGEGIIKLARVSTISSYGRRLLEENFGLKKKDFMSGIQKFLGGASFKQKTTGAKYNYLTSFEYGTGSSFVSIRGEGTNREALIEKYNEIMDYIFSLYETNKKIKNDPLLARRDLLLEEKKMIDKEYADLLTIEKDFGFTQEVESKKDSLAKRLLEVKKQLLDFERSQKEPYLEEIKIVSLRVSKTPNLPYGRKIFFLIYLGAGAFVQVVILFLLTVYSFKSIPPNVYFLEMGGKKL